MNKILTLNDIINVGKNKKILVSDIVENKGEILKLIKKGLQFDDEVLEKAHIKKLKRDEKVITIIVPHDKEQKKEYVKDTDSLKTILKSLNTLDNQNCEISETEEFTEEIPLDNLLMEEDE